MDFLKNMFRALKHDNYRYFFFGQIVSLIGQWMQVVAQSWLIYRLTGSSLDLGIVGFCNQIPILCLVCFGGVVADRYDKRLILMRTQSSCMILAGILAFLTLNDLIQVWHIYILAILLGIVGAFDAPARQALIVELVGKEDLSNAIVLNSSVFNGARLLGPAVAGMIINWVGEGWCFALNSCSYIAVLLGLWAIKLNSRVNPESGSPWQRIKEGVYFIRKSFPIIILLCVLGSMSMLCTPQMVLMPAVAKDILHGDASTLGYLMTMSGLGAFVGALVLANKKGISNFERLICYCMLVAGVCFIAFGYSDQKIISYALMAPIGVCMMCQMASSNTLMQSIVSDEVRGRVMSFHAMTFMGALPIGSLLSGMLAKKIGVPSTFALCGVLLIISGIVFALVIRRFRVLLKRQIGLEGRKTLLD